MHRVIGGIEIDHDLPARLAMHVHKQIHEQSVQLVPVGCDLPVPVAPGRVRASQFHPVQCARAREGILPVPHTRPLLARQIVTPAHQCQMAVASDPVMIVEIFVTQREPEHPLADQCCDRVLRSGRIPMIVEASPDPVGHLQHLVRFPQQKGSAVRRHPPTVKSACDLTSARPL